MKHRYITNQILKDLDKKIVLLTGPRQVGKTTLAKNLSLNFDYFNYDRSEHRLALKETSWDREKPLIIFDELHKMRDWKRWLKGIYDTEGIPPRILVTGSAKLNTFRKVGDSLAGRYFQFRLHPFDIKEAKGLFSPEETFDRLWSCSGFPEPFLNGDSTFYQRWQRSHLDIILRQDLLDIQSIRDIQTMEDLITLLANNVGSPISYANLGRRLEKDAKTIKNWLQLLEELYVIFRVTPYSKKISRSLLKEPKYYFYDLGRVVNNDGAKLENLVALALLKESHRVEDMTGKRVKLHFVKIKSGAEIDFLITIEETPHHIIEVKMSDDTPSKAFSVFQKYFPNVPSIQLVRHLKREKTYPNGIEIRSLIKWLATFEIV